MHSKYLRAAVATGATAALLAGCATTSTPSSAPATTGGSTSSATLTLGTTDKVTVLDPAGSYDNGSFFVMNQVFGFLLNTTPEPPTPPPRRTWPPRPSSPPPPSSR